MSGLRTVLLIGGLCAVTAGVAVVSLYMNSEWLALVGVATVLGGLILTRSFGHREAKLLLKRSQKFAQSLMPFGPNRHLQSHELQTRLQGEQQWESLWQTLIAFAERFQLSKVQLNMHIPSLGEEFHASWERKQQPEDLRVWSSEIPLASGSMMIGKLRISGPSSGDNVCEWMGELIVGLKPFETQLVELVEECMENSQRDPTASPDASHSESAALADVG